MELNKFKRILLLTLLCVTVNVYSEEVCDSLHSVVYKYAVNHKHELTHFNVYPPLDCNKKVSGIKLTKAWLKTACAYFSAKKPEKTYGRWRKPKYYFGFYSFDSNIPEIIILPYDENPNNPDHVVVLKSILNNDNDKNVCNGSLSIPYEKK